MKAEINQLIEHFYYSKETKNQLPWQRIPVEIWVKIFGYFGNLTSLQPKPITKLRSVCKLWRDVIDENLDFDVQMSDSVFRKYTLTHLRVKNFSVHNLRSHLSSNGFLFRDPTLVTSFSLSNKISRENFIILIDHLKNVNSLKINSSFLSSEANLFMPISLKEESIFNSFWMNIKSLHFNYDWVDSTNADCWTTNFAKLFSTKMSNMKVFTFNVPLRLIESHLPISFLLRNPSITDIDFRYCVECSHKYLLPNLQTVKQTNIEDFKRIQLRSIKLKAIRLYEYGHQAWLPIIKAQKSLVNLEISQYGSSFLSGNFVHFGELSDMIMDNCTSLNSLKLENFHFPDYFDAEMFRNLSRLHTLSLHLPQEDSYKPNSYIRNLHQLPASLVKLVLQNVFLAKEELYKILSMDYMKNLKFLTILGVEDPFVISELVQILGEKTNLQMLTLSPVVLDYFRLLPVKKGKHYCIVIDNNQRQVGKYFWLSRRLEFNCNAWRQALKS